MNLEDYDWYEVWIDEGGPYVLIAGETKSGRFLVFDPIEKKEAFRSNELSEMRYWLAEDEFKPVAGRMSPDRAFE